MLHPFRCLCLFTTYFHLNFQGSLTLSTPHLVPFIWHISHMTLLWHIPVFIHETHFEYKPENEKVSDHSFIWQPGLFSNRKTKPQNLQKIAPMESMRGGKCLASTIYWLNTVKLPWTDQWSTRWERLHCWFVKSTLKVALGQVWPNIQNVLLSLYFPFLLFPNCV